MRRQSIFSVQLSGAHGQAATITLIQQIHLGILISILSFLRLLIIYFLLVLLTGVLGSTAAVTKDTDEPRSKTALLLALLLALPPLATTAIPTLLILANIGSTL